MSHPTHSGVTSNPICFILLQNSSAIPCLILSEGGYNIEKAALMSFLFLIPSSPIVQPASSNMVFACSKLYCTSESFWYHGVLSQIL